MFDYTRKLKSSNCDEENVVPSHKSWTIDWNYPTL